MKAIVTGAAGFIGSHLARRLLEDGWSVTVVDNLSSGHERNVPDGAELLKIDLGEEPAVEELPDDGADAVFHLASHVGQELSFERPFYDLKANALATMILLDWCLKQRVPRFVLASSMNVYGDPHDPEQPVTEQTPVRPPSPYAVAKIASEHLCNVYEPFGIGTTSLRLFNVYGPGQDMANLKQGMVSIFMSYVARGEPILVRGSSDRFRDFVSVHDVVDAFLRCVDGRAAGKVYNVSSGQRTYVWELLEEIVKAFGHPPGDYPITYSEPTPRDQFGIYGDSGALRRDLGWEPRIELTEGIAEMARWAQTAVIG
jgi:UDP-glucose 4-epimerase